MRRCWWPGRQILLGQTTGQRLLRSGLLSQESTWEGAGSEGGEPWQLPGMLEKYVLTPCRGCIYLWLAMVSLLFCAGENDVSGGRIWEYQEPGNVT
jgi:hypothetical protein